MSQVVNSTSVTFLCSVSNCKVMQREWKMFSLFRSVDVLKGAVLLAKVDVIFISCKWDVTTFSRGKLERRDTKTSPTRGEVFGENWLAFLGDVDARISALNGRLQRVVIEVRSAGMEFLLAALFRALCACDIDFIRALGGFGEDSGLVGQHFRESPRDGDVLLHPADAVRDFADSELGDQRRVPRKNTEIAVLAGDLRLFG